MGTQATHFLLGCRKSHEVNMWINLEKYVSLCDIQKSCQKWISIREVS